MSLFLLPQKYYSPVNGYYDDSGKYIKSDLIEHPFSGTIQPVSGKEFANLDIAEKEKGIVKIFSNTQLPVASEGNVETEGAYILWGGKYYKLVKESIYQSNLINHFKYFGTYNRERNNVI